MTISTVRNVNKIEFPDSFVKAQIGTQSWKIFWTFI